MITHITDRETALTNTLRTTTEALKMVTAERDDLISVVARCRDAVPDGYASDWESGAIAYPRDVAPFVAAAFSELVAERDALRADAELAAIKAQEPVALIDGNKEHIHFPSDAMFHYWIGRNCTRLYLAAGAQTIPTGYKLLKDTTQIQRSFAEDAQYENGNYFCVCKSCGRQFIGLKRRQICKVCETAKEQS